MLPKWEVADVIKHANIESLNLSVHQQKTLRAIQQCRTAALGGHIDACDNCGIIQISYNSCRNRHCPKCQGHKREEWIQNRESELLPCTYYHVVFTLPEELNALAVYQPRIIYNALFNSVWKTVNQFGKNTGIQLGMIAVLHTWGQNLSLHPHLLCIIPGGGIDQDDQWKKQIRSNKYLFPNKALSKVFRAKFVYQLRKSGINQKKLIDSLFRKEWVVYAKRPFGGPKQVIEYIGRYTHKVAISNHRIQQVTCDRVIFKYKDYKSKGITKEMNLSNEEFVRRFALHILPLRFVRIRHFGILSSTWKRSKLPTLQFQLHVLPKTIGNHTKLNKCPCCKVGKLITIEVFGSRGPPKMYILSKEIEPEQLH